MKTAVKPQKCPNIAGDGVVAVAHFDAKMGKFARSLREALSVAFAFSLISGAFADPSFSIDSVQQRYPWDGTVDIHYTVEGLGVWERAKLDIYAKKDGGAAFKATNATVAANGSYVQQWNPGTNTQTTNCTMFGVMTPPIRPEYGDYMIVNLKTGAVTYENIETDQDAANTKYNTVEYKTTKMVFRKVPAGTYSVQNGATNAIMASDYYIGIFELTVGQYTLMTNKNASVSATEAYMKPQTSVRWDTIRGTNAVPSSFAGNLGSSGAIYKLNSTVAAAGGDAIFDLPTEAMWEVAARAMPAGDSSHATWKWFFASADGRLGTYAWYTTNSSDATHEVGTKSANPWGIYDIYGNVFEWCLDGSGEATWNQTPNVASGYGVTRSYRGGGYFSNSTYCSSGCRGNSSYAGGSVNFGYRLACICQ